LQIRIILHIFAQDIINIKVVCHKELNNVGVYLYSRDYKDRDELQGSRDFHVNHGALYLVRINILFKSLSEYFNAHICAKNIVPPLTGEGL